MRNRGSPRYCEKDESFPGKPRPGRASVTGYPLGRRKASRWNSSQETCLTPGHAGFRREIAPQTQGSASPLRGIESRNPALFFVRSKAGGTTRPAKKGCSPMQLKKRLFSALLALAVAAGAACLPSAAAGAGRNRCLLRHHGELPSRLPPIPRPVRLSRRDGRQNAPHRRGYRGKMGR